MDLVRTQLLLAQGASLTSAFADLPRLHNGVLQFPSLSSIQLRITAEDPAKNWSLSVGKIKSAYFPSGNGIRCDTNIVSGIPAAVTADFDSLIAKLIITGPTWRASLQKAKRALEDTRIEGVKTNLSILKAIIAHPSFAAQDCDTSWLEAHQAELVAESTVPLKRKFGHDLFQSSTSAPSISSSSQLLFRKDDAWNITLNPKSNSSQVPPASYHLHLTRLLKNDFPASLSADIAITPISVLTDSETKPYTLSLAQTSTSAAAASSSSRRAKADPSNKQHVPIPFSGKLVEVHVEQGDEVQKGETMFVVRQMKMELEVRAPRSGVLDWVIEIQEGEEVGEGWLGAVFGEEGETKARL